MLNTWIIRNQEQEEKEKKEEEEAQAGKYPRIIY